MSRPDHIVWGAVESEAESSSCISSRFRRTGDICFVPSSDMSNSIDKSSHDIFASSASLQLWPLASASGGAANGTANGTASGADRGTSRGADHGIGRDDAVAAAQDKDLAAAADAEAALLFAALRNVPGMWSRGSVQHASNSCKACHYAHTKRGCANGAACVFCHIPHTNNNSSKVNSAKREACKQLVEAVWAKYRHDPPVFERVGRLVSSRSLLLDHMFKLQLETGGTADLDAMLVPTEFDDQAPACSHALGPAESPPCPVVPAVGKQQPWRHIVSI